MKKVLVLIAVAFVSLSALVAQVSVDPNDRFYAEAQSWYLKGLVDQLPQLRPYPVNAIRHIIESVIAVGIDDDGVILAEYQREVDLALYEYERIFSKPYHIAVAGAAKLKAKEDLTDDSRSTAKNLNGEAAVEGDIAFPFTQLVTVGYHLGFWGTTSDYGVTAPLYQNQPQDSVSDASTIGPMDLYLNWNVQAAFGTENYYVAAGVNRVGYGPFWADGIALNDTVFHSANIMMNVTRPRWSFASVFETIGTTDNYGSDELSDNKFLSFHAIKVNVTKNWSVSYYENLVFGPEPNLLYILPAPYMAVQNIGGANSNLQMGLLFEYKPTAQWEIAADIFVDDVSVNDIAKLDFDTKIHVAGQFGLVFTPLESSLSYLTMHYTIVMPYTYAHWEYASDTQALIRGDGWNYQNYTNNGISMGASIPPDSDRVAFFARFNPLKNLQIDVTSNFIRHQNVAESFSDDDRVGYMLAANGTYSTDGSVFTHQMFSDLNSKHGSHVDAGWDHLSFMSGDHSMIVCQAGIAGEYTFQKFAKGKLAVKLGYQFELIHNAGVDSHIYPGQKTAAVVETNDDGTFKSGTYNGVEYSDYDALYAAALSDADQAYDAWVSQLTDKVNHYITLSVKYTY